MSCLTPDLEESLSTMRCVVTKRLRRDAPITVTRSRESDYSGIYAEFGFQFDGFSKYRFRNSTIKTRIYDDPQIFNLTEREIAPLATTLTVNGDLLIKCCNTTDYRVYVGDELCSIRLILKEKIVCNLPDSWRISGPDVELNITVSYRSLQ